MFAGDHMRRKMEDQWETYLRDTHLATPTKHAKGDKGRNEAAVHFVQNDVRSGDIDQVLVRFIELIDVEKLVISARDDLARLLIEDDAAALASNLAHSLFVLVLRRVGIGKEVWVHSQEVYERNIVVRDRFTKIHSSCH